VEYSDPLVAAGLCAVAFENMTKSGTMSSAQRISDFFIRASSVSGYFA
jgi:hypothetical protein